MVFTDEELERYARHILLKDVGGEGQRKLKAARVLVIGAGGLGAPMLLYLAAAGVGTLGIVDHDRVSLSNLQRQVIHDTPNIGLAKTASARAAVARLNPNVSVEEHPVRLTASNALDIISAYDIVADGTDNFETRYLVSDACFLAAKPLVWAAVGQYDGHLTTFRPHETTPEGTPLPTYRCLHPEPPPEDTVPTCEEAGILGALTGIIGSMQALEVLKELLNIGETLAGRLVMVDALATRIYETRLPWNPENPLNGRHARIRDLSHHQS